MLNKTRLYWTLQIGGWFIYFATQALASVLASGTGMFRKQSITFFFFEALLCLMITHAYRNYINRRKWLSMSLARLIPNVTAAVVLMGIFTYFLRMPVSLTLGTFNPDVAFDPANMARGIFVYAFMFFLWSTLHFIYNYFERYNISLQFHFNLKRR
jgi:two-component system, LytTR family, sensor kinase